MSVQGVKPFNGYIKRLGGVGSKILLKD